MSQGFVPVDFNKCSSEKYICCGGKNDGTIYQVDPGPCEKVEGEPENSFSFDEACCRCLPDTPQETRCPQSGSPGVSPRANCGGGYGDGWFVRQGSREIVLVWDGEEVYWDSSCDTGPVTLPNPYVVGDVSYFRGSSAAIGIGYGWPSNCAGCGPNSSPLGDTGSGYCITRRLGTYDINDYLGQCDKEPGANPT